MLKSSGDKELLTSTDSEFAFRVLYDRYWKSLFDKAMIRLGNEDDASDIVQDIFVSLWRNRHSIQVEDTLAPYLFTALKYAIIKLVYRRAEKGLILPLSILDLERHSSSTVEMLDYRSTKDRIDREVAQLPDRMREIYTLSRVNQLRNAEIARTLNISEQTVKNTLSITIKRLRSKVLLLVFLLIGLV